MTLREFLKEFDFDYYRRTNGDIKLIDLQQVNLGGIEQEVFHNRKQVIDRLNIYYEDYLINSIEQKSGYLDTYEDYLDWCIWNGSEEWNWHIEMLKIITGKEELRYEKSRN